MSSSTFFGLNIGKSGLYGANVGINTTAHNVSNAQTEGYSRQTANFKASKALPANGTWGMIGTGVSVSEVSQERSDYYDIKYRTNNTKSGYYTAQEYYLDSIEDYLNEIQLDGFNTTFNNMYDTLQELSKDPANLTVRTQFNNYAQSFTEMMSSISNNLSQVQENVNFEVRIQVESINSLAKQIAGLNKQINTLEVNGGWANDLRDARALLVDKLSNISEISVEETPMGDGILNVHNYVVKLGDHNIVDTYYTEELVVVPRNQGINQADVDGLYDVQWESGQGFPAAFFGGKLASLLEIRDGNNNVNFNGVMTGSEGDTEITVTNTSIEKLEQVHMAEQGLIMIGSRQYTYNGFYITQDEDTGDYQVTFALDEELKKDCDEIDVRVGDKIAFKGIAYYQQQLNEFARVFSESFNNLHTSGADLNNEKGLDYFNANNPLTGENYIFARTEDEVDEGILMSTKTGLYYGDPDPDDENRHYASYYKLQASNFNINKKIMADPSKVVTATDIVQGRENNDLALEYLRLKEDNKMFRQGTPSAFMQAMIAELGVDAAKSRNFCTNQDNILSAIENQRLSVSGVDTEEEAMNLMRFQNTYNLSAKVVSVMDEIFDRLINYMAT